MAKQLKLELYETPGSAVGTVIYDADGDEIHVSTNGVLVIKEHGKGIAAYAAGAWYAAWWEED